MNKTNIFVWGIIIVIAILAGIQWAQNTKNNKDLSSVTDSYAKTSSTIDQLTATTTNTSSMNPQSTHTVTIETNKGIIVFETYDTDAPKTVQNFIALAQKGFYNGTIFHRVIDGFMIQGGDPTGTGMGGPGYKFADELNQNTPSYKNGYIRGVVAMANSGPNTNGSQFFIMHQNAGLQHDYTIFGKVISGMDVVDVIATVPTNGNPPSGSNKPLQDVVMKKVSIVSK